MAGAPGRSACVGHEHRWGHAPTVRNRSDGGRPAQFYPLISVLLRTLKRREVSSVSTLVETPWKRKIN